MNTASTATASAQTPEHAPARAQHGPVPAHAQQLAQQLSTLFQRDVEIVKQLNDAHHRLDNANEQLNSRLAPDALALIHGHAAPVAIETSPIAALLRDRGPTTILDALQQIHSQIHHAFCAYQDAAEQRRQLAIDVGELSQQLTQTLCASGWGAEDARHANVHKLTRHDALKPRPSPVTQERGIPMIASGDFS